MQRLKDHVVKLRKLSKSQYNPLVLVVCVLNVLGFCTFKKGWRLKPSAFLLILFIDLMYLKDFMLVLVKCIKGEVNLLVDFEILTFIQTQGITVYRIFLLFKYKDSFKALVLAVTEEFPSWKFRSRDITSSLAQSFTRGRWIFRLQIIQMSALCVVILTKPLVSDRETLLYEKPLGQLPFVQTYETPFYQITYIIQICYMLCAICMAFSMNILFLTLLVRISGHLEHLAVDMEAIGSNGPIGTNEVHVAIQNFVDRYNRIRESVDLFNKLFSTVTAVLPLYAGFSIITSVLEFEGTGKVIFFFIAVGHVFELYIYCYASDLIAEMSVALSGRIFGIRWYEFSTRDKKSILQILQQCNKPFNIKAGFFGVFSMHMFTMTMKTTYSIWAVINQAK